MLEITAKIVTFPIKQLFKIAYETKSLAETIEVRVSDGQFFGRGEAVPYRHYGETMASSLGQIDHLKANLKSELRPETIVNQLPAGSARNALDCALWDLATKQKSQRLWQLASFPEPKALLSAYTLTIDLPENLYREAKKHHDKKIIKLKLNGQANDLACLEAVRAGNPHCRLYLDANESWSKRHYLDLLAPAKELGVDLIEQPFKAGQDHLLADLPRPIPVAADESCHVSDDLEALKGLYDVVNIKLDKTGGLTAALKLAKQAKAQDFAIMVGCMVGSSLSIKPAFYLAQLASYIDLDGPFLLAYDRSDEEFVRLKKMINFT